MVYDIYYFFSHILLFVSVFIYVFSYLYWKENKEN